MKINVVIDEHDELMFDNVYSIDYSKSGKSLYLYDKNRDIKAIFYKHKFCYCYSDDLDLHNNYITKSDHDNKAQFYIVFFGNEELRIKLGKDGFVQNDYDNGLLIFKESIYSKENISYLIKAVFNIERISGYEKFKA